MIQKQLCLVAGLNCVCALTNSWPNFRLMISTMKYTIVWSHPPDLRNTLTRQPYVTFALVRTYWHTRGLKV